MLNIDEIPL